MAEPHDKVAPTRRKLLKGFCENTGSVIVVDSDGTEYLCPTDRALGSDLKHFDVPLNKVTVEFTPIHVGIYFIALDIELFPNGDCPKDVWEKYAAGGLQFLKKKGGRGRDSKEKRDHVIREPSALERDVIQATHTNSTISPNITPPVNEEVIEAVDEETPQIEPIEEKKSPVQEEKEAITSMAVGGQFCKERKGHVHFAEVFDDIEEALERMELKEPGERKVLESILKPPREEKVSYNLADLGWPRPRVVVEPGWWKFESRVLEICSRVDACSTSKMHRMLNKWWYIPVYRYRTDYPFTLDGFVVPIGDGKIHVYTIRLGRIEIADPVTRKDRTYAYCVVVAAGEYRAWEFDERQPLTLEQVTPVGDTVECCGYALISPGAPAENTWFAWNDQCGWMSCADGCADEVREENPEWMPGCQLVKFIAIYIEGKFVIEKISLLTLPQNEQLLFYPLDLFYIDDIRAEIKEGEEIVLNSAKKLPQKPIKYTHEQVYHPFPEPWNYGGLICVTWEAEGLQRVTRALAVAPTFFWENYENTYFYNAARHLSLSAWDQQRRRKTPPSLVANHWAKKKEEK